MAKDDWNEVGKVQSEVDFVVMFEKLKRSEDAWSFPNTFIFRILTFQATLIRELK